MKTELLRLQTLDYQNKRLLAASQQPCVSQSTVVPLYVTIIKAQGKQDCTLLYVVHYNLCETDTNHTSQEMTMI